MSHMEYDQLIREAAELLAEEDFDRTLPVHRMARRILDAVEKLVDPRFPDEPREAPGARWVS